ncbi:MAG: hypothetical protein EA397_08425 [Deltaproteobacteria bacterium]|nr:MAG: hypothetical protein EA397_08425 [Deltaproteobacteria bacterium]
MGEGATARDGPEGARRVSRSADGRIAVRTTMFILGLGLTLLGCDPEPSASPAAPLEVPELPEHLRAEIGEPVATISGFPVGVNEYNQLAGRKLRTSSGEELTDQERLEVLQELIDQKVLFLEARRLGFDRDPRVQRVMVQILLQSEVYGDIKSADLTEEELRAYYERNRDDFIMPEQVRLRRIFIKAEPTRPNAEAEALARTIYERVKAQPQSFAKIAAETSEGPFRGRGGDLGLVSREPRPGVPVEVVERGFSLAEGGISEPFLAGGGYHILFLTERRERVERTFEQMRAAVVRRAKSEKQQQSYHDYLAEKRDAFDIETFPDRLKRLRVGSGGGPDSAPEPPAGAPSAEEGLGDE